MRIVIQRVLRASVTIENQMVSSIGKGLMILVGVREGDGVASEMLKQAGIAVYGESRVRELIDLLKEGNAK